MTYLILALLTAILGLAAMILARKSISWRALSIAVLVLLLMTAVFDNLIIYSGIVAYDENLISGLKLFLSPIEDFSYTILALGLVPAIFEALSEK